MVEWNCERCRKRHIHYSRCSYFFFFSLHLAQSRFWSRKSFDSPSYRNIRSSKYAIICLNHFGPSSTATHPHIGRYDNLSFSIWNQWIIDMNFVWWWRKFGCRWKEHLIRRWRYSDPFVRRRQIYLVYINSVMLQAFDRSWSLTSFSCMCMQYVPPNAVFSIHITEFESSKIYILIFAQK